MPRHGVQYVSNEEPAFISQFKQRIGHKDGPDVDTKRNIPNFEDDGEDDDDLPEKEDEKPVVVVISSGDLTAEEAQVEQNKIDEGPARLDEKITFKKPVKRSKESEEESTSTEETKKKKRDSKEMKKPDAKKTKNSSLLSFDDEEQEEDG